MPIPVEHAEINGDTVSGVTSSGPHIEATPTPTPAAFYYPQLDGLRTLAFFLVFGSHAGGFTTTNFPPVVKEISNFYNCLVQVGWSGVDLFFVLSAFLITSLLLREEQAFNHITVSKFLLRRVLRIWPLYFLAVVVGLLLCPFITEPAIKFGSHSYIAYCQNNLLWCLTFTMNMGMANFLACPPANMTPLWSISLEEQFYLFWGFFLKFARGARLRLVLLACMLVGTICFRNYLMQTNPTSHVPYYVNTFSRLDPLIFGTLVAFAIRYWSGFMALAQKFGAAAFVISAAIFMWASTNSALFLGHTTPFALTLFDFGYMLFLTGSLTFKPLVSVFSNKYVASVGRLTYGMYVIHAMVIQALLVRVIKPMGIVENTNESSAICLFVGLPVTFAIAWVLWHAYEKHFYKLKYKFSPVKSGYLSSV